MLSEFFSPMKKNESGDFCPLIRKKCIENKCSWYMHVRGMNPNTGEDVDHWSCAVTWVPMLTIENSQQQRQTGAAVESFRNEVVKANEENRQLYIEGLSQTGVLPVNVTPITNNNLLKPNETDETFNTSE
jgi:hypothetical protein